jgi:hypothetical protein
LANDSDHPARAQAPRRSRPPAHGPQPLLAAFALAAVIVVVNLLTTGPAGVGFLVLAPLLCAAWGGSPSQVTALTVVITALALVLGLEDDIFAEPLHVVIVMFELVGGGLAVYVALLRQQRERDQARLEIQFATARALQEAGSTDHAAHALLATIVPALGWDAGLLWKLRHPIVLDHVGSWHSPDVDPERLERLERSFVARPGIGLPGEVVESGRPAWAKDETTPRSELAAAAGLRGRASSASWSCSRARRVTERTRTPSCSRRSAPRSATSWSFEAEARRCGSPRPARARCSSRRSTAL